MSSPTSDSRVVLAAPAAWPIAYSTFLLCSSLRKLALLSPWDHLANVLPYNSQVALGIHLACGLFHNFSEQLATEVCFDCYPHATLLIALQVNILKLLLEKATEKEVNLIAGRNKAGYLAMHAAAAHGQLAVLRYLIEKVKVDKLTPTNSSRTLIHIAAAYNQVWCMDSGPRLLHGLWPHLKTHPIQHNRCSDDVFLLPHLSWSPL